MPAVHRSQGSSVALLERLVLASFASSRGLTRGELEELTGLSRTVVAGVVASLVTRGELTETRPAAAAAGGGRGRPPARYQRTALLPPVLLIQLKKDRSTSVSSLRGDGTGTAKRSAARPGQESGEPGRSRSWKPRGSSAPRDAAAASAGGAVGAVPCRRGARGTSRVRGGAGGLHGEGQSPAAAPGVAGERTRARPSATARVHGADGERRQPRRSGRGLVRGGPGAARRLPRLRGRRHRGRIRVRRPAVHRRARLLGGAGARAGQSGGARVPLREPRLPHHPDCREGTAGAPGRRGHDGARVTRRLRARPAGHPARP